MHRLSKGLSAGNLRIQASSERDVTLSPGRAIDGNPWTMWQSRDSDAPQWLELDLGRPVAVKTIGISWGFLRAFEYRVSVSAEGRRWKTVADVTGKDHLVLVDEVAVPPGGRVRHVRIDCVKGASPTCAFCIFQVLINGRKLVVARSGPGRRAPAAPAAPFRNPRLSPAKRAADLLARLTFEELLDLTGGYSGFCIAPLPRFGLPAITFTDASMGVRFNDNSPLNRSVSFPASVALAATWNPELARQYGRSIGEECRAFGVHTLLGPGVNIYRASLCGRNFEYLGEDPHLTSRLAVPYIQGLQSAGVMACIKHFACNNNDWIRHDVNTVVEDRAFREIYLPAFKAAIEEADVMAVMTAYNYWNGEKASQNKALITGVLRKELGFRNLIMSDWGAVWN
ncbi:MAG: glycoside hydrolase family 3 N-terminal domain-containing protein, partial [bacterium]